MSAPSLLPESKQSESTKPVPLPEPTRKSRSGQQGSAVQTLLIVVAAIALAALAIGSYVYFNPPPAAPEGQVEQVWVYPIHRESMIGGGGAGPAGVQQNFDQIMLLSKVKVHNPGKIPVFIHELSATATLPGDDIHRSLAAGAIDFNRVFVAYPQMAAQKQAPLLRDTTIDPGNSAEGLVVFNYPLTKEQWDARQQVDVVISFTHQADLVLKAPLPQTP